MQVAVADAGCGDLNSDLARLWRIERDVFNDERFAEFVADGGLHDSPYSMTVRRIPPQLAVAGSPIQ